MMYIKKKHVFRKHIKTISFEHFVSGCQSFVRFLGLEKNC